MYPYLVLCFVILGVTGYPQAPQHSADRLPDTVFSCRDKVLGGYYADPDTQCQMFHVCVKVAGVGIQDFRFLCPNGTAFDQEAQICAGWADVACDSTALYYSSDNFDLYRIGSGFESKKAPVVQEEESDFHLQRAEPDIFSGAHSSNFFNNREGKDNNDESAGPAKNQFDQPQRKKIVRKLQRRPTETTQKPAVTPARQFTNNFAGSYAPTTARPVSTTLKPVEYNDNSNYNQKSNNYQSNNNYKAASSTAVPYESTKFVKTEQQNQNRNRGSFRSRQPSTADYSSTDNNQQYQKQQTGTDFYKNEQYNKQPSSTADYGSYNQQSTPRSNFNKDRKQQTYQSQQSTTKVSLSPEINQQYNANKQTYQQYNENKQAQDYNVNKNNNQNYDYNQQSTPKYNNYNTENTQKSTSNQGSTSNNFGSNNAQPSTTQYNQYNQDNGQYNADSQAFSKIKSTTKYVEKKTQYTNANKQSTPQYNEGSQNYNKQQTPTPKYNTNLQYDNNQQSTPDYYSNGNTNYNQGSSQSPSTNQQYSTAGSSPDYNNYNQQKSTQNYQQYSTPRPAVSTNVNYNQDYEARSSTAQQYSTSAPVNNQYVQKATNAPVQNQYVQKAISAPASNQYVQKATNAPANKQFVQKSTATPFKSSNPDDYDDGQYRPELYEREAGGQYDRTAKKRGRQEVQAPVEQETELLKAAHSINIAASGNQLRDNRPRTSPAPSSSFVPFTLPPRVTTAAPKVYTTPSTTRLAYTTTTASPRSVYSSFAAVTSAAPRPFSARPVQISTPPPQQQKTPPPQQQKTPPPQQAKQQPAKSETYKKPVPKKVKDVSYDYQYYDNSDHYSEYENIEEFGRTSKKV